MCLAPTMCGQCHGDISMVTIQDDYEYEPEVIRQVFTQLSMKKELAKWKEWGKDVIMKELKQLHMCNTFEPVHPFSLTKQDRDWAIESHLFLKLKHNATVKGRMVMGSDKK